MNVTRTTLLDWVAQGDLDPDKLQQAIALCHSKSDKAQWLSYLKTALFWAAILFSTFGLIFFFAFNWQDMGRFSKFALLEFVMLLSAPLLLKTITSRLLMTASVMGVSLLTGALLALVGQTYQTGADPWQLFATWAMFIIPWVLLNKSEAIWALWIVLVNTALYLYLKTHHGLIGIVFSEQTNALTLVTLNTLLLVIFELSTFLRFKLFVSSSRNIQQLLALFAAIPLTFLIIVTIFGFKTNEIHSLYYLVWITLSFYIYRHKTPDLFILSATTLSAIIAATSLLIFSLESNLGDGGFLLITIFVITLSTVAAKWLKSIAIDAQKPKT
ncbi:MAG: DUF2157 domain-containing protein [Gammaproteobacteria bacterium]|nr:DUF2157 domain-containing protein [Gammaproteobacteria bacterium]